MTIAIIGHGYVGLVSAAVFADLGNTVMVVGRTKEKIENLQKGITPFFEPGLSEMVSRNVSAGRLKFTLDYSEAIPPAAIIFICVGTPSASTGEADLSAVYTAAKEIGKNLKGYAVVVTKSTVPVGTNREVAKIIKKVNPQAVFDIASCPEFLREGSALSDTMHPDRKVIGTETKKSESLLRDLHSKIDGELICTTIETAEMIKYASNSLLSTKISFANAMAFLCDAVGADVEQVLIGVGLDKRLGRSFLYPGVGFGGSCFPKDVKALIAIAKQHGYDFQLLRAVNQVNDEAKQRFIKTVVKEMGGVSGKTIAVWGLSFKPDTDDMRDAPAVDIIKGLTAQKATIRAFDPQAEENARRILPDITYCSSPQDAVKGSDALLLLTEWNEFKQIDLMKIKKLMKEPVLFDGRNVYDPEKVRGMGFRYKAVGRP